MKIKAGTYRHRCRPMKQSLDLMRDTFGLELEYEEQIGGQNWRCGRSSYINCWKDREPESASRNGSLRAPAHICFKVVISKAPSPN